MSSTSSCGIIAVCVGKMSVTVKFETPYIQATSWLNHASFDRGTEGQDEYAVLTLANLHVVHVALKGYTGLYLAEI
ncbi:hypothetical protein K474DRAFT_581352 [Panus rudis PR-1116 ss-1]|nr:hypothetical protein K474DRAFT_581352 [Panus rudis PR-1116 ss-1]